MFVPGVGGHCRLRADNANLFDMQERCAKGCLHRSPTLKEHVLCRPPCMCSGVVKLSWATFLCDLYFSG